MVKRLRKFDGSKRVRPNRWMHCSPEYRETVGKNTTEADDEAFYGTTRVLWKIVLAPVVLMALVLFYLGLVVLRELLLQRLHGPAAGRVVCASARVY
jgi:hypothetical protein